MPSDSHLQEKVAELVPFCGCEVGCENSQRLRASFCRARRCRGIGRRSCLPQGGQHAGAVSGMHKVCHLRHDDNKKSGYPSLSNRFGEDVRPRVCSIRASKHVNGPRDMSAFLHNKQ